MTTEYEYLPDADRETVDLLMAESAAQRGMVRMTVPDGREFYAYPCGLGIAWGINSSTDGRNYARGVESK